MSKRRQGPKAKRPRETARSREAARVRGADKATAIGRLLLGKLDREFFAVADRDYEALPRRNLRSAANDVKRNVRAEIDKFCKRNFTNMTTEQLSRLYDAALEPVRRGEALAIPLADFEKWYSPIAERVLRGSPRHCTVVVSRRGLQFMFPEDLLAKDLLAAIGIILDVEEMSRAQPGGDEERRLARLQGYACRTCVLGTFNLIEAYLNGIAWDVAQDPHQLAVLPSSDQGAMRNASDKTLRWKIEHLPRLVGGSPLAPTSDHKFILDNAKPLRDALVHPSPFPTPEKFGGHDKLGLFYSIDVDLAKRTLECGIAVVMTIHRHITQRPPSSGRSDLPWLEDLRVALRDWA